MQPTAPSPRAIPDGPGDRSPGAAAEGSRLSQPQGNRAEGGAARLELLEAAIAALPAGVILADPEGRFLVWNPAASALLHRGPREVPFENWPETYEVFHPDGVTPFAADDLPLVRALRGLPSDGVEMCLGRIDDPHRVAISVSGRPIRSVAGRLLGGLVLVHDLTEHHAMEAALRSSEERHRVVIQQTGQLIYDYDIGSGRIHWAGAIGEITGLTPEEIQAVDIRGWEARIHPEDRSRAMALLDDALRKGGQYRVEYRFQHKNGSYIHCEDTGAFVNDAAEVPTRMLGTMKDISARRHAEQEQRRLEAQLREAQRLEAIGRLAGGVAHDFNNLLMPILGFTEMLLDRAGPDGLGAKELGQIRAAAERARDLTAQLLAYGRRQVLAMQPLDLNSELRRFEPLLRSLVREDIELVFDLAARVDRVRADPAQIERVVLNLIVNARDAIPGAGRILVRTGNVCLDRQDVHGPDRHLAGPCVLLSVSDTGTGMDADTAARVFEPFFTTKPKGTGLGLATVFGLVRQHGGEVRVETMPGRGTTFHVLLPRAAGPEPQAPASTPAAMPRDLPAGTTILLVEDEPLVRELVAGVLREHGARVLAAQDGAHALSLGRAHDGRIDLLITDVIMPGMDGRQLHAALVAELPGLPALYVSGYGEEVIANHGVLEPGLRLVQKPFSMKQLLAMIGTVLGEAGRGRPAS